MAAVQAYACASGKGKKPSRTTNALGRGGIKDPQPRPTERSGLVVLRLLVFKHIRNWSYGVCICHRTGRSVTKG